MRTFSTALSIVMYATLFLESHNIIYKRTCPTQCWSEARTNGRGVQDKLLMKKLACSRRKVNIDVMAPSPLEPLWTRDANNICVWTETNDDDQQHLSLRRAVRLFHQTEHTANTY